MHRMLPPHERFDRDRLPGHGRDDRLIVEKQLILGDGPLQLLEELVLSRDAQAQVIRKGRPSGRLHRQHRFMAIA